MLVKGLGEMQQYGGALVSGLDLAEGPKEDLYKMEAPKLDKKFGVMAKNNPVLGSRVLLSQVVAVEVLGMAIEAKERFDRGMQEHKEKIDKANEQNKKTKDNVDKIREGLDRVSREMQERPERTGK